MSALAFTVLALMLVGPVPALLARASWTMRAPRASVLLWQSIALARRAVGVQRRSALAMRLFSPAATAVRRRDQARRSRRWAGRCGSAPR